MVSKNGTKKTKAAKPETPAVKPVSAEPSLVSANDIISDVVKQLAPEMNKSIEAKFEEMKSIFTNELKDIRKHMEAPVEPEPESPVMEAPQMEQR